MKSVIQNKVYQVILGKSFRSYYPNFPYDDQLKIAEFIHHIEHFGFTGLKGRNKPSHHVPKHHPNWSERVKHAQEHHLWHYHIGIPYYQEHNIGDFTSEYVLHYILGDDFIKIVAMSPHPPLILPNDLE